MISQFRHVLDDVNGRDDVLPNITLGCVALDDCLRDIVGLAQTLNFLPITTDQGIEVWPEKLNKSSLHQSGILLS